MSASPFNVHFKLKRVDEGYYLGSWHGTRFGVQKVGEKWRVYGLTGCRTEAVIRSAAAMEAERERKMKSIKKQKKRKPYLA
jgi:hypothetical protein